MKRTCRYTFVLNILEFLRKYLEADLFIHGDGPVGEGNRVAETGLPLDSLLSEIHDNLGSFGIRMEQKWAHWKGSADGATLDREAPLGFVVTSV